MKRLVDWRIFVPSVVVAGLIAWAVYRWAGVPFWVSAAIVVSAILINGFVALIEDEIPGGFNNPRKKPHSDESP